MEKEKVQKNRLYHQQNILSFCVTQKWKKNEMKEKLSSGSEKKGEQFSNANKDIEISWTENVYMLRREIGERERARVE